MVPELQTGAERPTVVVGIAGTVESDAALRWAVQHAGRVGADVLAISVWQSKYRFAESAVPGIAGTTVTKRLPADVRAAARRLQVELRGDLVLGFPAEVLVQRSRDAVLLVLGNTRRGGVTAALLGSVSRRCLRYASCPVVVVPCPDDGVS